MISRLDIHIPSPLYRPSPEKLDQQRIYDLVLAQGEIARIFDELADRVWLGGDLIEGVTLSAGVTKSVEHKLGRVIRGYIIGKQNDPAVIFNDTATTVDNEKFIALQCAADITFDIIVY